MKIPYNCLHTHSNVLFAARGGKIHTFDLLDGAHIATWQHPELQTSIVAEAEASSAAEAGQQDADDSVVADEEAQQPPSKRQKVMTGESDGEHKRNDAEKKTGGRKARGKEQRKPKPIPVPDRPTIIQLTTSSDGSHLVAVSSHDKAVWVFQHDGSGHLTQLSKRVMPKRPSAITVSPDAQILVADKFGDVYAIPLIKSSEPYVPPRASSSALAGSPAAAPAAPAQPAATVLTVHSKGNRAALAAQQRQLEHPTEAVRAEGPDFAHTLLLGHVSMLTALALAEDAQRRRYILTADRDEHIRVSRHAPAQSHVIHGYCLGHREFVGAMTVPSGRRGGDGGGGGGNVLVSGGGDEDLLVWDWLDGRLLSRTSILSPVREVDPQARTVAVSRLLALDCPGEHGPQTHIVAICEGIPAVFSWQLVQDNTLTRPGVIQLPGKPLDVAASTASDGAASLSVALHVPQGSGDDEAAARSLHTMRLVIDDGRLAVDATAPVRDEALEGSEQDVTEGGVRTLFYTVEHLRKQQAGGQEEGEAEQQGESVAEE